MSGLCEFVSDDRESVTVKIQAAAWSEVCVAVGSLIRELRADGDLSPEDVATLRTLEQFSRDARKSASELRR